ncbi:hypothetical protein TRVA0_022S01508 [Trichomonascus vanleenenianus]|uniref:uncharacterized protein n=1 Tax=Trichomonascus vanleenenianus TaxID=2268995 RepID=UPI003ECA5C2C
MATANESGAITADAYCEWIKHFDEHTETATDANFKRVLLTGGNTIADNRASDLLSFVALYGIEIIVIPTALMRAIQRLEVRFIGSLKEKSDKTIGALSDIAGSDGGLIDSSRGNWLSAYCRARRDIRPHAIQMTFKYARISPCRQFWRQCILNGILPLDVSNRLRGDDLHLFIEDFKVIWDSIAESDYLRVKNSEQLKEKVRVYFPIDSLSQDEDVGIDVLRTTGIRMALEDLDV